MENIPEKIILDCIKKMPKDAESLNDLKRLILRNSKDRKSIPTVAILLKSYHKMVKSGKIKKSIQLEKLLTKRAVRTLSGVSIVTVLTKPFPCPGQCIYCPSDARMPKSYLADEPAAARALMLQFDPYEQVKRRIEALTANGHPTDKIELIVKGGTWNSYPIDYQYWFILRCFEACDGVRNKEKGIRNKKIEQIKKKLKKEQRKNETSKHRIVGLTLETRPDHINEQTIWQMREMGCTRIELGVQTTDEKILKAIKRGHDTAETKRATELLRNYGFKVDYHLMPQLPGATPAKDLKMLLSIFSDPGYKPDMIKIYPCTVIENSELYEWLQRGDYKTYSDRNLINILKKFKTQIPRYCRVSRLIRDIPAHHVKAGNITTNLRQVIQKEMAEEGLKCNCLRCREIGHQIDLEHKIKNVKLFTDKYKTNGGTEYFLSYEDSKRQAVFAFCRLRINNKNINPAPAIIRELHTYGQLLEIGTKNKQDSQHQGLGKKLVQEAEKIAKKNKSKSIAVISGVGVRSYYRKLGYKLHQTYMIKKLP
ncbi:MAG: Histone acetyltransferase [Candidatus Magasanikbacteria bacterium GW2011_GWA2_37_8]|uniref:tRNA carboxymethyluridine synthase n=1 Tax=Candidatus Magasanikbacteria bacterium GW2011_GWA2_37_8 TaxID=1619036 RepID=A0A0G0H965_9BACT|nr:MAG: Histone acetyltransferase [Candidatus Magasanikbacteria bacterium GW2011_GWA2_37_8]